MSSDFFPKLPARRQYRQASLGHYYGYSNYYDDIAEDCLQRCVYCDALLIENLGGDKMQLDHFRPQEHFSDLKNDPNNLLLACPRCNRLKSSHWPADITSSDTHDGVCGFVDPFVVQRNDYFDVEDDGSLEAKRHPSSYMIKLLKLNSPARNLLRKRRKLARLKEDLFKLIDGHLHNALDKSRDPDVPRAELERLLEQISDWHHRLRELETT